MSYDSSPTESIHAIEGCILRISTASVTEKTVDKLFKEHIITQIT